MAAFDKQGGGTDAPPAVDFEAIASVMGHIPKDQWRGREDKWVDAETFLRTVVPNIKQQNRELHDQVKQFQSEIQKVQADAAEHTKFLEQSYARQYAEQVKELQAKRALAITEGDGEAAVAAEEELAKLKPPKQSQSQDAPADNQPKVQPDPHYERWIANNEWADEKSPDFDKKRWRFATGVAIELRAAGKQGKAFFEALDAELEEEFGEPEPQTRRGNNGPQRGGRTNGGGGGGGSGRGRTYNDLPADAKAQCDRAVARGYCKTKEEWVKHYEWD